MAVVFLETARLGRVRLFSLKDRISMSWRALLAHAVRLPGDATVNIQSPRSGYQSFFILCIVLAIALAIFLACKYMVARRRNARAARKRASSDMLNTSWVSAASSDARSAAAFTVGSARSRLSATSADDDGGQHGNDMSVKSSRRAADIRGFPVPGMPVRPARVARPRSPDRCDPVGCSRDLHAMRVPNADILTNSVCPLCLRYLTRRASEGPCGHQFHTRCIHNWTSKTLLWKCPMCCSTLIARRQLSEVP
jgi:hypothetical protein